MHCCGCCCGVECRSCEQLLIHWHSNGRTKWVKRLNLILQDEDRAAFRFRLMQAQQRRDEVSGTDPRQGIVWQGRLLAQGACCWQVSSKTAVCA